MNPQMKTQTAGSKGNKKNFHCYQNPKEYSTNNRKASQLDYFHNYGGYSNLPAYKGQYQNQYPSNNKNALPNMKKHKHAPYPMQKNVGVKHEYLESFNYAKNHAKPHEQAKLSPDRTQKNLSGCSTMPSEEELTNSILHGFKVVHNGRTLHDEAQPDETYDSTPSASKSTAPIMKFAGSTYNIGPNPKDISLPSFFYDD